MFGRYFFMPIAMAPVVALVSQANEPPCPDRFVLAGKQLEAKPATALGPKKISVTATEAAEIRQAGGSFYTSAREFADQYGKPFLDLVGERVPKSGDVTIAIAMGGAEHLGTLLETSLPKLHPRVHFKFRYVDLSTKRTQFWVALRNPIPGRKTGEAGTLRRSGIGPVPAGYTLNGGNDSDAADLAKHLSSSDVLSSPTVLVIDTGFNGSTVEVVAHVARNEDFPVRVEGVLLQKSTSSENTAPVFSLNHFIRPRSGDPAGVFAKLAVSLDHNNVGGSEIPLTLDAFQRSSAISPDRPEALLNYKATLQGIEDGLARAKIFYARLSETVLPAKMVPAVTRKVFRDPPPKSYFELLDLANPIAERRKAMSELQTWLRETTKQRGDAAVEQFFDDVIASTDRFGEAFGTQIKVLNLPELHNVVARRDANHAFGSTLRFEDFLSLHSAKLASKERPDSADAVIIGRVRNSLGDSSPLEGARNLDEYMKFRISDKHIEFVRRTGWFKNSFNQPLRGAKLANFDIIDYISRIRRDGPSQLDKLWRGLELDREFKQRFPDPALFWKSEKSFLNIYRELDRNRLPPTS